MWRLFGTKSSPRSIQDSLQSLYIRVKKDVEQCIVSESEGNKRDITTVDSGLTEILTVLLTEDRESAGGYAPGLLWTFSESMYDQLTAWAQLDKPSGLFSSVLRFYTYLLIDIQNQDLLHHYCFNRALLSLLICTNERLLRAQLFTSARETVLPLIHVLCTRLESNPTLTPLFLIDDHYIFAPILTYFLLNEHKEDLNILECVLFFCQIEHDSVAGYLENANPLVSALSNHLSRLINGLPRGNFKGNKLILGTELEYLSRFVRFLDELCGKCLHSGFLSQVAASLLTECLQPCISPYITSSDPSLRTQFTLYLLQITKEIHDKNLLFAVCRMIKDTKNTHFKPKFESFSTHSSETTGNLAGKWTQRSIWEEFLSNLNSENAVLRLNSWKLLSKLLNSGIWDIITFLITDFIYLNTDIHVQICTFEQFLSHFPGSLLYNDMKSANLYYFESLNCIFSRNLPPFQPTNSSFIGKKTGFRHHRDRSSRIFLSNLLYGEEKCGLETDPGPILKLIFLKMDSFLSNNREENLLITGILANLCRFPPLNSAANALFAVLFNPLDGNSLFSVLKRVFFI